VMDQSNYKDVIALARNASDQSKVDLLLNESQPGRNARVPDPYYEGGFEGVYQMVAEACQEIVVRYT